MAVSFENWAGGTAGFGSEPAEGGSGLGNSFLNPQALRGHAVKFLLVSLEILGVGDGRLEGLGNKAGPFARHDGEDGLRLSGGQTLNLTDDFTHFLRGHPNIFHYRLNFHK